MKSQGTEELTPGQMLHRARNKGTYIELTTPGGTVDITGDPDRGNKNGVFRRMDTLETVDPLALVAWISKYECRVVGE